MDYVSAIINADIQATLLAPVFNDLAVGREIACPFRLQLLRYFNSSLGISGVVAHPCIDRIFANAIGSRQITVTGFAGHILTD